MSNFVKKINELNFRYTETKLLSIVKQVFFIFVCGVFVISFASCSRNEVDLRTLVPKDTIIYLETNNLENTLNALTESKSFKEHSKSKRDFSVIEGLQLAVAISGFETSENKVTDEQSVLNFKPKFTAIAETHAWSWQITSLVENNLNAFVEKTYGNDTKLEQKSVNNTERYIWTSSDGRQTFAVISGSQVFFGNDEESINKCLSAKRGETENLLKNEKLSLEYEKAVGKLAFGFISNGGIKQIADFVGVTVAVGQSENSNARGFIARILPQILNNTTKEITWTAEKKEAGIEDKIYIKTNKEVSNVFSETLTPANKNINELYEFIPRKSTTITRYNLKNPQVAFRSLLLVTAKNTDAVNAKIINTFSNSLLLQYGVANAEAFLSLVEPELLTSKIDDENGFAIVKSKDLEKIKLTLIEGLKLDEELTKQKNIEIWKSEEDNLLVAFYKDVLILGDLKAVEKVINDWGTNRISPIEPEKDFTKSSIFSSIRKSKASTVTFNKDYEITEKIVSILGTSNDKKSASNSIVETKFSKREIERKYVSDFGFLGTIIEQFGNE